MPPRYRSDFLEGGMDFAAKGPKRCHHVAAEGFPHGVGPDGRKRHVAIVVLDADVSRSEVSNLEVELDVRGVALEESS